LVTFAPPRAPPLYHPRYRGVHDRTTPASARLSAFLPAEPQSHPIYKSSPKEGDSPPLLSYRVQASAGLMFPLEMRISRCGCFADKAATPPVPALFPLFTKSTYMGYGFVFHQAVTYGHFLLPCLLSSFLSWSQRCCSSSLPGSCR